MCPVAPKTSHTFCLGGLDGPGGSVVCGSEILDMSDEKVVFSERWVEGDGDDGLVLLLLLLLSSGMFFDIPLEMILNNQWRRAICLPILTSSPPHLIYGRGARMERR